MLPVLRQLGEQATQDHLPSALLLSGPRHLGKRQLAEQLRQILLCQNPKVLNACGECKSCLLSQGGAHPDSLTVEPEEAGKPIKIDQIRRLSEFVYARPQIAQRRVLIINPAEEMNLNAANALLKTLEEPAATTYLILLSHRPASLLPTIRSRCAQFPVGSPGAAVVREWLSQLQSGTAREAGLPGFEKAWQVSFGAPLRVLEYLGEEGNHSAYDEIIGEWESYLSGKADLFSIADLWSNRDTDELLTTLIAEIHQRATRDEGTGQNVIGSYQRLMEIARNHREKRNLNPSLQWEHWLMKSRESR